MENSDLEQPLLAQNNDFCRICEVNQQEVGIGSCGHSFCKSCLCTYLSLKVTEGDVLAIYCPFTFCPYIFQSHQIEEFVPSEIFFKYLEFYNKKTLESNIYFRWCPKKQCSGYDVYQESSENSYKLTCNICSFNFCFLCTSEWHPNKKCEKIDADFAKWRQKKNVKSCPFCFIWVEKSGGCPHMTCSKCKNGWCWKCGKIYSDDHNDILCVIGNSYFNLPLWCILLMIFFPILFPFTLLIIFLILLIFLEDLTDGNRETLDSMTRFMVDHYCATIFVFFVISPPLIGLSLTLGIIGVGFGVAIELAPGKHNQNLIWGLFLLAFILGVAGVVMALCVFVLIILLGIIPILGIVSIFTKIGYVLNSFRYSN